MPSYYYYVHETPDLNSKVIFSGTATEVANKFHCDIGTVGDAISSGRNCLQRQYGINRVKYGAASVNRPSGAFKRQIKTIETMLDIHGNTIAYKNINKIVKALENDGYFVNLKHEEKRIIHYKASGREVYPECWIIELDHKEKRGE